MILSLIIYIEGVILPSFCPKSTGMTKKRGWEGSFALTHSPSVDGHWVQGILALRESSCAKIAVLMSDRFAPTDDRNLAPVKKQNAHWDLRTSRCHAPYRKARNSPHSSRKFFASVELISSGTVRKFARLADAIESRVRP
jgi:hypothetical protein